MKIEEMTKPCYDFIQEIEQTHRLEKKMKIKSKKMRYHGLDFDKMQKTTKSLVEVNINFPKKKRKKKKIVFHCGIPQTITVSVSFLSMRKHIKFS